MSEPPAVYFESIAYVMRARARELRRRGREAAACDVEESLRRIDSRRRERRTSPRKPTRPHTPPDSPEPSQPNEPR